MQCRSNAWIVQQSAIRAGSFSLEIVQWRPIAFPSQPVNDAPCCFAIACLTEHSDKSTRCRADGAIKVAIVDLLRG